MDVVDFVENICGTQLYNWQKTYLRFLYGLSREYNIKIVMGKNGQVFTYLKSKESTSNGKTNDCK